VVLRRKIVKRRTLEGKWTGWPALMKDRKNLRMNHGAFIQVFIVRVLPDINAPFCRWLFRYLREGRVPPWERASVRDSGPFRRTFFPGRRVLVKSRQERGEIHRTWDTLTGGSSEIQRMAVAALFIDGVFKPALIP